MEKKVFWNERFQLICSPIFIFNSEPTWVKMLKIYNMLSRVYVALQIIYGLVAATTSIIISLIRVIYYYAIINIIMTVH